MSRELTSVQGPRMVRVSDAGVRSYARLLVLEL